MGWASCKLGLEIAKSQNKTGQKNPQGFKIQG